MRVNKFLNWTFALAAYAMLGSGCSLPPRTEFDDYQRGVEQNLESTIAFAKSGRNAAILVSRATGSEILRRPFRGLYEMRVASVLMDTFDLDSYTITWAATREDLETVLLDENTPVVVIAGHGDWTSWVTSGLPVTKNTLEKFLLEHPQIKRD